MPNISSPLPAMSAFRNDFPHATGDGAGHTTCRIFTRRLIAGNHIGLHFLKWLATKNGDGRP